MQLPFTHLPGRRERHLRRRHENPLFAWPPQVVAPADLLAAQGADHADLEAFRERLAVLLQQAVDLPADAGSETVLRLKGDLEVLYEQSYALPEDHQRERTALARLLEVIMGTVRRHAGNDPLANQELADEAAARAIHFQLLEQPLIADLLHPQTMIAPAELLPTLLSASEAEVSAACELFDDEQLVLLVSDGEALIAERAALGCATASAALRLTLLQERLTQYRQDPGERLR